MPASLTYPGVYIEELSSGVHTISGVSTSIAAFVGWAAQGPTDQATLVGSWGDFQTQFGGLDSRSYLGYSVNQFFANGGQQAYIIRLVMDSATAAMVPASPPPPIQPVVAATAYNTPIAADSSWKLFASSPGIWGNGITVATTAQPGNATRFSLQVSLNGNPVENFVNLSIAPADPQFVFTLINNDSAYITFIDPSAPQGVLVPPTALPDPTDAGFAALANGADGTVLVPGDGNFENALLPTINDSYTGVQQLDRVNIFNLLCVPGVTPVTNAGINAMQSLQDYCASRRAFYLADGPQTVLIRDYPSNGPGGISTTQNAANSAFYFPWVLAADPLAGNRPRSMPPCGFVAGVYAATDASRGVWKAPAGVDTGLTGALGLQYDLTDGANGLLNASGANCLRNFKVYGNVVWGARTLAGNDQFGSQWKYVPIRRLALFIESSLYDGTQWVVFEPNDEPLWGQIRLNVGAFMQGLFLQGAFQGTTPQQAYFVKCDSENNPQSSIDLGIVNILVGFAPLYPAEFVVIQIQQIAGQV
jgi:phage tail sheath protein FI